jgi:hypothetical protein
MVCNNLAFCCLNAHRPREAEDYLQRARQLRKALSRQEPQNLERQRNVALVQKSLGYLYQRTDRPGPAEQAYQAARTILERLGGNDARAVNAAGLLAGVYHNLALLGPPRGPAGEMEEFLKKALDLHRALTKRFPSTPVYRRYLADTLGVLGNCLLYTRPAEAAEYYRNAAEVWEALYHEFPQEHHYGRPAVIAHLSAARAEEACKRPAENEKACRRAVELAKALTRECPREPSFLFLLGNACTLSADFLWKHGKTREASDLATQAINSLKAFRTGDPDNPLARELLSGAYLIRGRARVQLGQFLAGGLDLKEGMALKMPSHPKK